MFAQVNIRFVVLVFAFCQTMGVMCAVPDLSLADDVPQSWRDESRGLSDGRDFCLPAVAYLIS